jgi:lysophospholipase L1-like esterase
MAKESENKIDICVFGDSICKGVILQPESGRYEALNIDLNDLIGKSNINIKNYSMMGSAISKGLSVIKRHGRELYDYANIFLEFGGNDCDFLWNELSGNPYTIIALKLHLKSLKNYTPKPSMKSEAMAANQ